MEKTLWMLWWNLCYQYVNKPKSSQLSSDFAQAKEEIFIADWFLSPFIYLRRERNEAPFLDDRYRLDNLLVARAEAGVMVISYPLP